MSLAAALFSLLLSGVGVAVALASLRMRMNPYFGFRVGYSMVSEEVWRRVNFVSGVAVAVYGGSTAPLSLFLDDLGGVALTAFGLVLIMLALTVYSERVAERALISVPAEEEGFTPISSVAPPPPLIASLLLTLGASIYVLAAGYPALPPDVAVHFSLQGAPDLYVSKTSFLLSSATLLATAYALTLGFMLLGARRPMVFHRPWMRGQRVFRRFVYGIYAVLSVAAILASYALIDTVAFNLYGRHPVDPLAVTVLGLGAVVTAVIYVASLARGRPQKFS